MGELIAVLMGLLVCVYGTMQSKVKEQEIEIKDLQAELAVLRTQVYGFNLRRSPSVPIPDD